MVKEGLGIKYSSDFRQFKIQFLLKFSILQPTVSLLQWCRCLKQQISVLCKSEKENVIWCAQNCWIFTQVLQSNSFIKHDVPSLNCDQQGVAKFSFVRLSDSRVAASEEFRFIGCCTLCTVWQKLPCVLEESVTSIFTLKIQIAESSEILVTFHQTV